MDTDSSIYNMAKFMKQVERLLALRKAVGEYVDSYGYHSTDCPCYYCDMVRALEKCHENI